MRVPARIAGVVTAGYGALILAHPSALAGPIGLGDDPRGTALARHYGIRDIASGAAVALARPGVPLAAALAARIAADFSDAATLGAVLPEPAARRKAAVIAGGWGVLCFVTAVLAMRDES